MKVIYTINDLRSYIKDYRVKNPDKRITLVPTMGFLHEGHLELIRQSNQTGDFTAVSIFINPAQFNDPGDYEKYPVDIDRDISLCEKEKVDLVFIPSREEIYPDGISPLDISLSKYTDRMEGEFRPGHFNGVMLICARLFNLFQPDAAIFGKKDYQQMIIVKKMAEELSFPVEILAVDTLREEDGVAMSSRNVRLDKTSRKHANLMHRGLILGKKTFYEGNHDPLELKEIVQDVINSGSRNNVEYVEIFDPDTLDILENLNANSSFIIAAAMQCGEVRLIDNIAVQPDNE